MKIEYIGPKVDGERHMRAETGIEWFPGAVHDVSDAHAALFLAHPTSWKAAEAGAVPPVPKPVERPADEPDAEEDPVTPQLHTKPVAAPAKAGKGGKK